MRVILALLGLAILVSGCAQGQAEPVTVPLQELHGSGVSGTATFTPSGNSTNVELQVQGGADHSSLTAHIHSGVCDAMNPIPRYYLSPVMNGRSVTRIPGSLESLFQGETLALNLHPPENRLRLPLTSPRSVIEEIASSLACGELRR